MQANRPRDTAPEVRLRRALHARGLRFRKHYRPVVSARCEVDVAFTRIQVAVLIDGCFWHRCPVHATDPKANGSWWETKLSANVARDRRNDTALREAGWTVLRFWEHEALTDVVETIDLAVRPRPTRAAPSR
jgi:DNA mismatch endonuclease, patch repair protein